jgi:hypothetical protein
MTPLHSSDQLLEEERQSPSSNQLKCPADPGDKERKMPYFCIPVEREGYVAISRNQTSSENVELVFALSSNILGDTHMRKGYFPSAFKCAQDASRNSGRTLFAPSVAGHAETVLSLVVVHPTNAI